MVVIVRMVLVIVISIRIVGIIVTIIVEGSCAS